MKRKWFHTKEDPLYLSLLLVVVLFFISVLAACFSFLIMSERKMVPQPNVWQQQNINEAGKKDQGKVLDPEEIKVAQLSGEVVETGEDSITLKTVVYGSEEETYTITLPEESLQNLNKYVETGQTNASGLPQIKKQAFDFGDLEPGDFVTFSFPLEVPVSEIESKSLVIEEVVVDDEYDPSLIEE